MSMYSKHIRSATKISAVSAFTLAIAFLAMGCEEGPAGIFSSVANEKETSTSITTDAIETSSPSFVAKLGDTYYAGIGTLWSKTGDVVWSLVEGLNGKITGLVEPSKAYAGSGAVVSVAGTDTLFVSFSDSVTGNGLGVWSTTDGSNWVLASDSLPSDQYVRNLLAANDTLFVVTSSAVETTESYSLYYFAGTQFQATSIVADASIGLPDSVAYSGTSYWFTAGGRLISGTAAFSDFTAVIGPEDWAADSTAEAPLKATYGGVCAYGTGVIVSSRSGMLYYLADGASTWIASGPYANSKSASYSLSQPVYLEAGGVRILVVGTNGRVNPSGELPPLGGYLEFDITAGFSTTLAADIGHALTSTANNFDTSLSGTSVGSMVLMDTGVSDSGAGTFKLFALTNGKGLWSNTFNGTAWGLWVRE